MTCKHWRELDLERGSIEYCVAMNRPATCGSSEMGCPDPRFFNCSQKLAKRLRDELAAHRTAAAVEPFITK